MPRRSTTLLLPLLPLPIFQLSVTVPKLQLLYDDPRFVMPLSIALGLSAVAGLFFALRMVRMDGRRAAWLGVLAIIVALEVIQIFRTNPQTGPALREVIHIWEYGALGGIAMALCLPHLRGVLAYAIVLSYGIGVGSIDEIVQHFHPFRRGDVRDVLTNAVSCALGIAFVAGFLGKTFAARGTRRERRLLSLALGAATSLLLLFYAEVHLGFLIVDPAVGSFRSLMPEAELMRRRSEDGAVARYRAVQLRDTARPVYACRDFYLTEARGHVLVRGERSDGVALLENAILEKYYAPALVALGAAWPETKTRDLDRAYRRAGGHIFMEARSYVSPVSPWIDTRFDRGRALLLCPLPLALGLAAALLLP